ncbi:MAG: hypothetical protein AMS22_09310 [Thiotrichales bacterium SG8_50]|nr:MAG: hypothetical protein AMS22_09310 [Thiotrichales bacterium SG8_50]
MSLIRLLIVTDEMEVGGTQRQIATLLEGLDKSRFSPTLLYFRKRSHLVDQVEHAGVETVQIPKRGAIDPGFFLRLRRFLQRGQFDVVHCFSFSGELWGALALTLVGKGRLITSIRGVYEWYRPFQWIVKTWVTRRSFCVVANSQAGADYARRRMKRAARVPIEIVYNGITAVSLAGEEERARMRGSLGVRANSVMVLFVGRLVDHKNIPSLIRAFQRIDSASRYDIRLFVAGEGPERELLVRASKAMRAVVLPSRREGLSNAILEAMAAGKPVVASRVGGNVELVAHEETGLLYPGDDDAALAEAIERLAADCHLRNSLGAAARIVAQHEFSREAMIARTERLYEKAAGKSGGGSLAGGKLKSVGVAP